MTQEEFIKKDCELIQQRAKLKEEFIRTNSPIKSGTKVKVTRKGTNTVEYGILSKYDCEFHKIIPVINKIKKDGTPAKVKIWVRWDSVVEPCE